MTFWQYIYVEMFGEQDDVEDDDGPPPGWDMPLPTSQLAEAIPSGKFTPIV